MKSLKSKQLTLEFGRTLSFSVLATFSSPWRRFNLLWEQPITWNDYLTLDQLFNNSWLGYNVHFLASIFIFFDTKYENKLSSIKIHFLIALKNVYDICLRTISLLFNTQLCSYTSILHFTITIQNFYETNKSFLWCLINTRSYLAYLY